MTPSERWLVLLLRVGGLLTGSAVFAVFLTDEAMASSHHALGLGEFPRAPLTSYLTRSLSAMYAFHGVVLWVLSTDVRRYRPMIVAVGWATAALGLLLTGIDLTAPMPSWWTLAEGPWVTVVGLVLVALARAVRPVES